MVLAPMSGISDLPFRMINRSHGCGLAFLEMINIRSLCSRTNKTRRMMVTTMRDRPLGIQFIGHQPEFIPRALELLAEWQLPCDLIDFNAACPAPKLALKGAGAGMMKTPAELAACLRLLVNSSWLPVTVKIRTGWDKNSVNAVDIAKLCSDAGVQAIFIHGRTREQGYRGAVDYQTIRRVKQAVKVPVIGSGNIWSVADAARMLNQTGCDGVAIARGALGNPWIFAELNAWFAGREVPPRPAPRQIAAAALNHAKENVRFYGETMGVIRFRKHLGWYLRSISGGRALRRQAFLISSFNELKDFLKKLITENKINEPIEEIPPPVIPG